MNVVPHTPKPVPPRTPADALKELQQSCDTLRLEISQVKTVAEAFSYYRYISQMAQEMARLADQAGARCDDLLRET